MRGYACILKKKKKIETKLKDETAANPNIFVCIDIADNN